MVDWRLILIRMHGILMLISLLNHLVTKDQTSIGMQLKSLIITQAICNNRATLKLELLM